MKTIIVLLAMLLPASTAFAGTSCTTRKSEQRFHHVLQRQQGTRLHNLPVLQERQRHQNKLQLKETR